MKLLFASIAILLTTWVCNAQGASARVAYIDMEYILKKMPEYIEANNQLEQKASGWKKEVDTKKAEIKKVKDNLSAERTLLTRELIEEREESIMLLENELLEFQQKRFGANGDLITQKIMLVKPIQDQVFTVIQEIADAKRFDYVLDKGTESTMLFATKRHDISEQVIQRLERAKKRQNLSTKEVAVLEDQDKAQDQADLRREKREEQARRKKEFEDSQKKPQQENSEDPKAPEDSNKPQGKTKEEQDAENQALLKEQQKRDEEALKQKQLDLAAQRQKELDDRKAQMEQKQQEIAEQKRLAEEQRKRLQQERLKEIEEQKAKIEAENKKKQQLLDDLKKQREQEALNQNGNKSKVDMNQLVEERKKQQEKIQQEINRKKEIALEERKAAIAAAKKAQEERLLRVKQQQEDARKAREELLKNSKK